MTYRDARSGQAMEVSAINMTVSLPDLASPFAAKGSLVWNGEQVSLAAEGDLSQLKALTGRESLVDMFLQLADQSEQPEPSTG